MNLACEALQSDFLLTFKQIVYACEVLILAFPPLA
jgi:hypothetical protein